MGSKSPDFPDQSPAAAAASAAQLESLNSQKDYLGKQLGLQNLIMAPLLRQLGLSVGYDNKTGKITSISAGAGTNMERQRTASGLALQREISALKGQLPIDAQTTQELDRQEQALREQLSRSLGPDYAASTAGQQALADFQQRRANIVDSAARKDALAYGGLAATHQSTVDAGIQTALGVTQSTLPGIQVLGQNAAGYGSIVSADNQLRMGQYQAALQSSDSMFGGIGSLIGTIGGAALLNPSIGSSIGNLFGGGGGSGLSGMLPDIYAAAGL